MAELVYPAPLRALDANDNPVAGAELRAFRTDTTTPLTLYADDNGTTAHPVPLLADANGLFPALHNTSAFGVRIDIVDPVTKASLPGYPINRAIAVSTSTGAAGDVSFAPTATIPETNVQAAIARVETNIVGAKTGEDAQFVSGTPGVAESIPKWNSDGDQVEGYTVGTAASNLVQLDGSARLPAVDGSQLTDVNAGGMKWLARADASADAAIDFTAFDGTLYDAYVFELSNVVPATDNVDLLLRLSNDGGSTFISSANYEWRGTVNSSTASQGTATDTGFRVNNGASIGNDANKGVSGTITLFAPHVANFTTAKWDVAVTNTSGGIINTTTSGMYQGAAEVHDAVRFVMSSGNIASGIINMYGLRRAA